MRTKPSRLRPSAWCTWIAHGVLAAALAAPLLAAAAAKPLPAKPFTYKAQNVPLVDVLRDFAGAQGLPLVLADGVSGTVNANFNLTPESFIETISRAFGLIWYYDGVALYVYPSSQMQTRLFKLKGMNAETVQTKLMAFGLGDKRYPLRFQSGTGMVMAFGPPRHIELIEAMISAMTEMEAEPGPDEVKAFALVHVSAVDRTVQGTTVRGVASTLSQIYASGPPSGIDPSPLDAGERLARLEGTPEQRARRDATLQSAGRSIASGGAKPVTANPPASSVYQAPAPKTGAEARRGSKLTFTADEATNTVIVRAPHEQLGEIGSLIRRLDVPSEMIEIEATIIDISSDEAEALGFDWRYQSSNRDIQISPTAPPAAGNAFNITTLLRSGGWELLTHVRALESRGSARIVSQPKVLGAVNRTALLSDKQSAAVRVAGNQDAQLFTIEAGTTLQVTPRLILDANQTRIAMDLLIEDGGFTTNSVDDVPVVKRTTIRTDATLNEGQALLVGGIVVEDTGFGRSGIPFLSKLPVIGALFRVDESHKNRRQRLFLLTPKRVLQTPFVPGITPPISSVPVLPPQVAIPVPRAEPEGPAVVPD
jgi:type III secretion protein C